MKKIFKRVIVPLLALVIALTAVPVAPVEAAYVGTPTGLKNYGYSSAAEQTCYVTFNAAANADGYEYICKHGSTTISKGTSSSPYVTVTNLSRRKAYKVRVRAFSYANGYKTYGSYSKTILIVPDAIMSGKLSKSVGTLSTPKMRVGWDKIAGATNYYVYISTSPSAGFKKIKTLGKNTNSLTISSYNGKKLQYYKNYYIKIRAKGRLNGVNYYSKGDVYRHFYFKKIFK